MSKPLSFSDDEVALMVCVLKQLGGLTAGKVNYELVQREFGLASKGTAQGRWFRLSNKLKNSATESAAVERATSSTPKRKSPNNAPKTPKKKRKIEKDMEDGDGEMFKEELTGGIWE